MGWDLRIETPLNYSFIIKFSLIILCNKGLYKWVGTCELKWVLIVFLHKKSKWDDNFFVGHKKAVHEMEVSKGCPTAGTPRPIFVVPTLHLYSDFPIQSDITYIHFTHFFNNSRPGPHLKRTKKSLIKVSI